MKLENKTVWITGASSGIGRQLAIELSKLGVRLILSARRRAELEATAALCKNADEHTILPFDLSCNIEINHAVRIAHDLKLNVDLLINNAGLGQRSLARDTDRSVYERLWSVNFSGPILLTQLVIAEDILSIDAKIVAISSLAGRIGVPFRTGYSASKHALEGFFKSLNTELLFTKKSVLIASLGFVNTDGPLNALVGDGRFYMKKDRLIQKGMPADICATKIIKAISTDKHRVVIAGKERHIMTLEKVFPRFSARLMARSVS